MNRKMSVEGVFYPDNSKDILTSFDYFNDIVSKQFTFLLYNKKIKALIVPHAGYMYSGFSANLAYRNVKTNPTRVVVIGPSHTNAFEGMSLKEYEFYETPLGDVKTDYEYIRFLKTKFHFVSYEHKEHSTEVQFPFVKHYFPQATLVEVVYGKNADLNSVIEEVMQEEDTLLLISTDLSHFYNQKKANELDSNCIRGIEKLNLDLLKKGEACGMQGVVSLINVVKKTGLHIKSIDYRTSGDITGDMDRVVGYYSAIVYKGKI